MSGFGEAIGRALGGIGGGLADLGNKYITEEMAQQRAQALEEMRFETAKKTEAWQQSDEVQGRRMVNERKALEMRRQEGLQGKIDEASSAPLQEAYRNNKIADARAENDLRVQQTIENSGNKEYLKGVAAIKLADPEVKAKLAQAQAAIAASGAETDLRRTQGEGARIDVADKKRLSKLLDEASEALNDKDLSATQRGEKMAKINAQIGLIRSGHAGGESDTVKITETENTPTGERKIERTERRKPGATTSQAPAAATPSAGPWQKFASKPQVGAAPAAPEQAPRQQPSAPTPDALTTRIQNDLSPLVEDFQQAQAAFQAAARSGDPRAVSRYQSPLMEARRRLEEAANSRLGNAAPRFLSTALNGG